MAQTSYTASQQARAAILVKNAKTWTHGTRKSDGQRFVLFPSSKTGHAYYTSATACTCSGYLYRGQCSHELAVRTHEEQQRESVPSFESFRAMYHGCLNGCGEIVERQGSRCDDCAAAETRRLETAGRRALAGSRHARIWREEE